MKIEKILLMRMLKHMKRYLTITWRSTKVLVLAYFIQIGVPRLC